MATRVPVPVSKVMEPWTRRDPFRAMREEMDDLFSRFFGGWSTETPAQGFSPDLDLSESGDSLEVRMDLPGVKPADIEIEVTGTNLRISGERKEERQRGRTYYRTERGAGTFSRSITLPCSVREDKIEAVDRDGILTITLPKTEEAKTRKIAVKTA